jgi:hypothetical protein
MKKIIKIVLDTDENNVIFNTNESDRPLDFHEFCMMISASIVAGAKDDSNIDHAEIQSRVNITLNRVKEMTEMIIESNRGKDENENIQSN